MRFFNLYEGKTQNRSSSSAKEREREICKYIEKETG